MCSTDTPSTAVFGRPLELVERELTELASHIHAAMCRWLELVAEYDARAGWAEWGCRSCADWVSWRCSIAPVAAREHVRVARRLGELPLIRAAFAEGRLSYSKVRALTRLERVEHEDELLGLAEHATAAQLERLVRGYRRVVASERAATGRPERWLRWEYDDDGSLLVRGRLPAEEGAVVVAALEAARERLAVERADAAEDDAEDASAEASRDAAETAAAARADALVALADTQLAEHQATRSGGDRYQVVVHVDAPTLAGAGHAPPVAAPRDVTDCVAAAGAADTPAARCGLADGAPLAAETVRRLACDASLVRILDRDGQPLTVGRKTPQHPARTAPRPRRARPRLPVPGLHRHPVHRRASHPPLGRRWPHRPRQPRQPLPPPPPARARGRLRRHPQRRHADLPPSRRPTGRSRPATTERPRRRAAAPPAPDPFRRLRPTLGRRAPRPSAGRRRPPQPRPADPTGPRARHRPARFRGSAGDPLTAPIDDRRSTRRLLTPTASRKLGEVRPRGRVARFPATRSADVRRDLRNGTLSCTDRRRDHFQSSENQLALPRKRRPAGTLLAGIAGGLERLGGLPRTLAKSVVERSQTELAVMAPLPAAGLCPMFCVRSG
jgi:Domain of unknown function (DUF222)